MKFKDWDINLKVRLIGEAFTGISFWMVFPFLTVYFSGTLGREITSLLLVLSQVIAVFCGLFGGYFADLYGRKTMMLIAIFGELIGYGIFAFASYDQVDLAWLGFIGFTIASIFFSFYNPAASAMVADVVSEKERSYVYSVFYTVSNLSIIVGPLIGAVLFIKYRFYLLLFVTISYLILYFLLYVFTHETAPIQNNQSNTTVKNILISQLKNYQIIFSDKIFLIFVMSGILVAQTFMQLDMFIPLKVDETIENVTLLSIGSFDWNIDSAGLYSILLVVNGGLVVLLSTVITKYMMRYEEKVSFIGSTILYGISILIIGLFTNPWIYIFGIFVFTIGEILKVGVQQNFVAMLAPEDKRGMYFSAASLRYNVGRVIAPLSITLTAYIGFEMTSIVLAVGCFIATYLYIYMFRLFEQKKKLQSKAIN